MNGLSNSSPSRRSFLAGAAGLPALACMRRVPGCWLPAGDNRTLVVIELEGGNDGLGTLIPTEDSRWRRVRPTLSRDANGAHRIGESSGVRLSLHASMQKFTRRFKDGQLAVVQGIGYEPSNRSHFRSRDIWHTADPTFEKPAADTTGWLGRLCDKLAAAGAATPGLSVGSSRLPLALRSSSLVVPSLATLEEYTLRIDSVANAGSLAAASEPGGAAEFAAGVADEAIRSAGALQTGLARYRPRADYPKDAFARAMQLVARVVTTGFGTRILHTRLGGFDTHANQTGVHGALLATLDAGLGALLDDLERQRALDRVVILVHSEFGRRVAENGSLGTDHGAAGLAFVTGGKVRGGLYGGPPDVGNLDDLGDLRVGIDFRRVYADVAQSLGVTTDAGFLGGTFDPLGIV